MTHPAAWAIQRHVSRLSAPRGRDIASPEETAVVARRGVEGFAADYLGWRRSALIVTSTVLVVAAVLISIELIVNWQHHVRHRTAAGVLIEVIALRGVIPWLVACLTIAATIFWSRLRHSLPLVVAAAIFEVLPPFLVAMLPPHWLRLTPVEPLDLVTVRAMQVAIAAGLGLRLIGLLSAGFRSAVVSKLLLPESAVPGAMMAALTPINLGFAVAGYVAINAVVHGWALFAAWACLVTYQLLFFSRGTALLHPQDDAAAARALRPALLSRLWLLPLMGVFFLIFLFTRQNSLERPIVDAAWLQRHWVFLLGILSNYVVTLVVGTDLIIFGIASLSARHLAESSHRSELLRRLSDKATSILTAGVRSGA